MTNALIPDHAWFNAAEAKAVLVSLRTGRILASVRENAAGRISRTFVSPVRLVQILRGGMCLFAPDRRIVITWSGLQMIATAKNRKAVCQDAEIGAPE